MVVVIALGSACCYAAATALQQRSARQATAAGLHPRLLVDLAHRPLWQLGVAANVAAYGLQFLALGRGSLVLVQPLLVSALLFALPLGALLSRARLHRREWIGAVAIVAGLSSFLSVAAPARGRTTISFGAWAFLAAACTVPIVVVVAASRHRDERQRAMLLAAGAGLLFALMAALTKVNASLARAGLRELLGHWPPYALLAVGGAAVLVVQSAYQAGPLSASLPVIMVVEPLASVGIGTYLFHEQLGRHGLAPLAEIAGLAAIVAGIVVLARSPVVAGPDASVPAPRASR